MRASATALSNTYLEPGSTHMRADRDDLLLLEDRIDRLKDRLRIAVIHGGDKTVSGAVIHTTLNTRSWKSYASVAEDIAEALRGLGFQHVETMPDDMTLGERLRRSGIEMAWLNTAGVQGYNPACHAASMLEMMGIPYIGHDPLVSSLLDNKQAFKRELVGAGLPTAPFMTWHLDRGPFRPDLNRRFGRVFEGYNGPFIVKPASGRASLHVNFVPDVASLPEVVEAVFAATENHVLIESFLPGREFCVAVAGPTVARGGHLWRLPEPFVFSATERVLGADEPVFTSMDHRPITLDRIDVVNPGREPEIVNGLHQLARDVFLEFNLRSIVRLDVRADKEGRLHVLEANPKPDLKRPTGSVTSLVCADLASHGMSYDDLIMSLFADRLDFLWTRRPASIRHIRALLD